MKITNKEVNEFYAQCVKAMHSLAKMFDTTYELANIWLFVIIQPLLIVILLTLVIYYKKQLSNELKK